MMKFIIMILFMSMMLIKNNLIMFYYNLCYFISFMMIFNYMFKVLGGYGLMGVLFGQEFYSIWLLIMSVWIIGLMIMSLNNLSYLKLLVFISLMLVLIMFFLVVDLLMFYFLFEISLIPTFFLIIYWGSNPERLSAAYYLMMYMLLISFPLLLYIFNMYMYSMTLKFDLMKMIMGYYEFSIWQFFMVFMSFFIKMPIYIMHIWLPKAHVEAPVYGSMILAGILLKMGSYGIIRFFEIFFKEAMKYSYLIFSISLMGSMLMSLNCLVQVDMKSLVAYSSVVHMNMMLCLLLTFGKLGILSSYIMMISHGLCSSGLFYMVNLYYSRTSSRLLMLNKGMLVSMPSMSVWWFLLCSANFSFPFSLGFISEMMMLMCLLSWDIILMIYLFLICLISSAYSLYLFSYIQHGSMVLSFISLGMGKMKEFMILIMHFFPLILFLLNLSVFM